MAKRELTGTTRQELYQFLLQMDSSWDPVRGTIWKARNLHQTTAGQLTQEQRRKLAQLYGHLEQAADLMDEIGIDFRRILHAAIEEGHFNPITKPHSDPEPDIE